MKRLITNLKVLRFSLLALLTGGAFINADAQAPWCDAKASYTYQMSSSNYLIAPEQIRISVGGTQVYNKPAGGFRGTTTCGGEYLLANSTTNAFSLTAGSKYTIESSSSSYYYGSVYSGKWGAYIDLNNDKDFLDNGEFLGTWNTTSGNASPGGLTAFSFTLPCNITPSATRLRVICEYQYGATINANTGCHSCTSYQIYYGATTDFSINLTLPTSLSANFTVPSPIWVKTVNKFINSNQTGYIEHAWDANNDGSWEQIGANPDYSNTTKPNLWTTPGNKCMKLRSTNCLGKDSIVKCFTVQAPTSVPQVDFVADRVEIPIYESIRLFDLSKNGPYEWTWDVYDSTTYATQDFYPSLAGTEVQSDPWGMGYLEDTQNPEFAFDIPGCYTVVLTAKNDVGPSAPKKKVCYITVTLPTDYLIGYGVYGPNNDNIVGSTSGMIYDNWGANKNYDGNQGLGSRSFLQITPCNAKKIVLTMSQLKFKDAGDILSVWDGKSPGGPGTTLLASWSVGAKVPQTVTATSGSMYILFESDAAGFDSGYIGSFTSELGPASVPTPAFTPSTVPSYSQTPVKFTNNTTNLVGVPTWEWFVNDVSVGVKKDLNYTFTADGQYDVCLDIKSCVGNNRTCQTIDVVTPNQQTTLDLKASKRRPNINVDMSVLTPISDNANRFEYTIFPTSYTLINPPTGLGSSYGAGFIKYGSTPGDSIPTPILKFGAAGCYTITVKAWNSQDPVNTVKTIVKNKFICAVDYCVPNTFILSSDVGINRVKVSDGSIELINNYSTSGVKAYTDYSSMYVARMTYGRKYDLEITRTSTVDPANRKVWIDWNIDGDFDDVGEEVLTESASQNQVVTKTIEVPALSQSFEGFTRMRVAANYNNETTTPCGPITAGEYEDYGIFLSNDNAPPVITLNGQDTVRIEVGSSYTDAGATAWDISEGDITSAMTSNTDLETTVTGQYTYEYNVTDKSGNKAIPAIRTIIVVNDLTPPVLTLNPGSTGCITARRNNPDYVDPGASATDNKNPLILTSSIIVEGSVNTRVVGNYTIKYTVRDVAGNQVVKTRNVCVVDNEKPYITPLGDTSIQIGSVWLDQTIVGDDYDNFPVLNKEWGFNGPVNTLSRRTYPVTYTAVDSSGNVAIPVVRNYRVDDFIAPVISLNTFDIVEHDVRTKYSPVDATVSDNYYSYSKGEVSLRLVSSTVKENILGTYFDTYEAIDGSGNISTKIRTVKVVDKIAPRVWGEIIHGCVGENIWPMWGISTTDNYYSPQQLAPLVEIVNQNVNPMEEGIYTITYRVTDPSGNTSDEFTRIVYYTYWPKCYNSTVSVDNTRTADQSVNVYPNPTNGNVNIELSGATIAQKATVQVYNAMGQLVVSREFTETGKFNVDLSGYAAGIYTVKLISDGEVVTKQVILQ